VGESALHLQPESRATLTRRSIAASPITVLGRSAGYCLQTGTRAADRAVPRSLYRSMLDRPVTRPLDVGGEPLLIRSSSVRLGPILLLDAPVIWAVPGTMHLAL